MLSHGKLRSFLAEALAIALIVWVISLELPGILGYFLSAYGIRAVETMSELTGWQSRALMVFMIQPILVLLLAFCLVLPIVVLLRIRSLTIAFVAGILAVIARHLIVDYFHSPIAWYLEDVAAIGAIVAAIACVRSLNGVGIASKPAKLNQ